MTKIHIYYRLNVLNEHLFYQYDLKFGEKEAPDMTRHHRPQLKKIKIKYMLYYHN